MATINPTALYVPACGGEVEFDINYPEGKYWYIDYTPSSVNVKLSQTSGYGSAKIKVLVYPRCADYAGGVNLGVQTTTSAIGTLWVNQYESNPYEKGVKVSVSKVDLSDTVLSKTISITGTEEWFAYLTNPDDFTISKNSGTGADSITITAKSSIVNTTTNLIVATGCLQNTIPVTYTGSGRISLDVSAEGGTFEVGPYNTGSWSITSYPSWMTLSATSGSSNLDFTVTVPKNISESERSGEIVIQCDGNTYTVAVSQEALSISLSNGMFNSSIAGGKSYDYISYNLIPDNIRVEVVEVNVTTAEVTYIGESQADICVTFPALGGEVSNNGVVYVYLDYGDITFTRSAQAVQTGSNYKITPTSVNIPSKGGSGSIAITSDYPLIYYDSIIGNHTEYYTFNRVSDKEIRLDYNYPLSLTAIDEIHILMNSDKCVDPITVTRVTQEPFVLKWEFEEPNIFDSTESTPDIDRPTVLGFVQYQSNIAISDLEWAIEYIGEDEWIQDVQHSSYEDGGRVSFEMLDNRLGSYREAKMIFYSPSFNVSREVTIVQYGAMIWFEPSTISIGQSGGFVTATLLNTHNSFIRPSEFEFMVNGEIVPYTYEWTERNLSLTWNVPINYGGDRRLYYYVQRLDITQSIPLTVEQEGIDWDFPTNPINLGCEGGQFDINFYSSADIPNIIISNVPSWLVFTRDGNTLIGQADPNGTDNPRSVTINITAEGFDEIWPVTISQENLDWELLFTTYEFPSDSIYPASIPSEQGVIFDVSDKITDLEASTDADWLRLVVNSPGIQVWASSNRLGDYRTSTVTLYSPYYNSSKTLIFNQRGLQLSLTGSEVISCEENTITVNGSIPEGWVWIDELSIVSPVDVTIAMNEYDSLTHKNCNLVLTVPFNSGNARIFDCEFYVNSKYVGKVTITQESCDITVDTPEITFDNAGGSAEVYIESTLPWTIEIVGDWITVTPSSGDGDGIITISASKNEFAEIRTGYVYISTREDREAIVINQVGAEPYLYFNKHYIPVRLGGDIQRLKLYNNLRWTTKWETQ